MKYQVLAQRDLFAKQRNMSAQVNGYKHEQDRIQQHTEEKNLPGGWCVLKFGGTSVGKFAGNICSIVA
jgi:aspartate kinase